MLRYYPLWTQPTDCWSLKVNKSYSLCQCNREGSILHPRRFEVDGDNKNWITAQEKSRKFEGRQPTEEMEEQMKAGSRCALRSNVGKASRTSDPCTPGLIYLNTTTLSRNSSLSMLKILRKYGRKDARCPINHTGGEKCMSFEDASTLNP